jgi:hypothetical protein
MRYYLLRPDGSYSDYMYSAERPQERPEGQWVQGEPTGREPYQFMNLNEKLGKILETAARSSDLSGVPAESIILVGNVATTLERLAPLVPAPLYALAAKTAIETLGVLPGGLETVRQQMLALCNAEIG